MDLRKEQDPERLRQAALVLDAEVQRLLQVLKLKSDEIDALKGTSGTLQDSLKLLEALRARANQDASKDDESKTKPARNRAPQKGHGPKPQTELKRQPVLFEHDEPDRTCPCCGKRLKPMAGQFEVSEMIDVVDVEYRLIEVQRQKYTCQCGGVVETAPGPERAIDGGRYSLPFAVKVGVDKYDLSQPLARQARSMKQYGLHVDRHTLWDQIYALTPALRLSYEAVKEHILSREVIGLDQTGWPCLDGKRSKPWQMWCLTTEDAVFHAIRDDKSASTFCDLLGDYSGIVVCDALSTHTSVGRGSEGYQLAHCFAHVVRRFRDAAADFPQAEVAQSLIRKLYDIEEKAGDVDERRRLRQIESVPVMDELWTWLTNTPTIRSTSLDQAVRYTIGIWSGLRVFLENPRVWLDNNRSERGLRGPVVGRKNYYGAKSERGTQVASIYYTLIETAKLHGVPARTYIAEAVRAGRRGEIILPWQMAG